MAKAKMNDSELLQPIPAINLPATDVAYPDAGTMFKAQKAFLSARLSLILNEPMTEENIARVRILKKGIVGWRTAFEKQVKDYVSSVYKSPMAVFNAAANEVMADIKAMEDSCDKVLAIEEEKRIAEVNTTLDGIIEDLQKEYGTTFSAIERKKQYYNKTADFKAVTEDIRVQFEEAIRKEKQKEADKELIKRACAGDERLNEEAYLSMLEYEVSSVVLLRIEKEKERLKALEEVKPPVVESVPEKREEPKLVIGEATSPLVEVDTVALKSDFPGLMKEMVLKIKYPVDTSSELTRIFGILSRNGIKLEVISKKEPAEIDF